MSLGGQLIRDFAPCPFLHQQLVLPRQNSRYAAIPGNRETAEPPDFMSIHLESPMMPPHSPPYPQVEPGTPEAAKFLAEQSPGIRIAWNAFSTQERRESGACRGNPWLTRRERVLLAWIGSDTVSLDEENLKQLRISRESMRVLARKYGASLMTLRDSTWTCSTRNLEGDASASHQRTRLYRYVVCTDTLEFFEDGHLVRIDIVDDECHCDEAAPFGADGMPSL